MAVWRSLEHKIKWVTICGVLAAILTALEPKVGVGYPPVVGTALTALSAILGGYAAPAAGHVEVQDAL